jgi:NAD(P)-dependent dehydrogenase (short-subunit alcohol dehydrogenase family)
MLLENKVAVIYGGGGPIGGAAAKAFVREGATVFIAGRTQSKLDKVAAEIRSKGGKVETAIVDALDEQSVNSFVDSVVKQAGQIDISFNVIGVGDIQKPLSDLTVDEFLQPIINSMRTHFITDKAALRHMIERKSGVMMAFGGGGTQTVAGIGGFKVALDALEGLRRQFALEYGQYGIRVVTLTTGGIPESIDPSFAPRDEITKTIEEGSLLKRAATLEDVGNVAAFVASDWAKTLTSTDVNISCGAIVD